MCVSPILIDVDGRSHLVACRHCWSCLRDRKMDWIGRSIAEQKASSSSLAVTLTYCGGGASSRTLVYSDYQNFIKRLRSSGYRVRYIVAGEYGTKKGRAHWHAITFYTGTSPQVTLDRRVDWSFWPHGFSYFQRPDYRGFAYLLKYIFKDTNNDEGHFAMSKKPPLGDTYFDQEARRHVELGVAPSTFEYSWLDVVNKDGKLIKFRMSGKTRQTFARRFVDYWSELRGSHPPMTEGLQKALDSLIPASEIKEHRYELLQAAKEKCETGEISALEYSQAYYIAKGTFPYIKSAA